MRITDAALDALDVKTALRAADLAGITIPPERLVAAGDMARAEGRVQEAIEAYLAANAAERLRDYGTWMLSERGDLASALHIWRSGSLAPPTDAIRAFAETSLRTGNLVHGRLAFKQLHEEIPRTLLVSCGDALLDRNPKAAILLFEQAGAYKRLRRVLAQATKRDDVVTAVSAFNVLKAQLCSERRSAFAAWLLAHDKLALALDTCPSIPDDALNAYLQRVRNSEQLLEAAQLLGKRNMLVPQTWINDYCIAQLRSGASLYSLVDLHDTPDATLSAIGAELLALGRTEEALDAYQYRYLVTTPDEYLTVAHCALAQSDLDTAMDAFELAGAEPPDDAIAKIAAARLDHGAYMDALVLYEHLLRAPTA